MNIKVVHLLQMMQKADPGRRIADPLGYLVSAIDLMNARDRSLAYKNTDFSLAYDKSTDSNSDLLIVLVAAKEQSLFGSSR